MNQQNLFILYKWKFSEKLLRDEKGFKEIFGEELQNAFDDRRKFTE